MQPIDILFLKTFNGILTHKEMAKVINKSIRQVKNAIKKHKIKPNGRTEYALYRSERFLGHGSKEEIKKRFGISESNFWFCTSPSNLKRLEEGNDVYVVVRLGKVPIDYKKVERNRNMLEKAFGKYEEYWSDAF